MRPPGLKSTLPHALPQPPPPEKIKHAPIGLLISPSEVSSQLKTQFGASGGEDTYVFCNAYMEKPTEGEMANVNGRMLKNFTEGLKVAGLEGCLRRVVLTTGTK